MYARTRPLVNAKGDGAKRDGESARATRLQHVHREKMLRRRMQHCLRAHRAQICMRVRVSVRIRYVCETIYTVYGIRDAYTHIRGYVIRRAHTWRT